MTLDRRLKELFDIIRDEARQNPAFGERLATVLSDAPGPKRLYDHDWTSKGQDVGGSPTLTKEIKRGNRRTQAVVDPVTEIQHGEGRVRELLARLDIEQLRDVVAEYRMDPNKLVMRWKDRDRIVEHIITTSISRARKGDAFRT
jgi:hypothetical protein